MPAAAATTKSGVQGRQNNDQDADAVPRRGYGRGWSAGEDNGVGGNVKDRGAAGQGTSSVKCAAGKTKLYTPETLIVNIAILM